MRSEVRRKLALTSIFFTYFIDTLNWSIVLPIFAPFFLDIKNHLFDPTTLLSTRTSVLGIFLAIASFGQFFGAPLLGEYADRHGRKRALSVSVFCAFLGTALTAWAIKEQSLHFLFIGRLISGFFSGSSAICMASIADLHQEETQKVKQFGILSVVGSMSFIVGAFIGGEISDSSVSPLFSPSLPLWIATGLSALNFIFVIFWFQETNLMSKTQRFSFWRCFSSIWEALQTKRIKLLYAIFFLFLFSWAMVLQFIPVLTVENFDFTNSNLGELFLFMGVFWAIGSGSLNKTLIKYFSPLKILEASLIIFTVLCALIIYPLHLYGTLAILAVSVMLGGLAWPLCNGLISRVAPQNMQGKVLGISQSLQSLAMAIAPAIGGVAYQAFDGLPFLFGAASSLGAGIIYFFLRKRLE